MPDSTQIVLPDPEATHDLGRRIGLQLRGGEFVALCGPLGAGKTHFVKGLALGLGVDPNEPVVSPTFVLVREYRGRLRLLHADAYRLGSANELDTLGLDEQLIPDTVLALEWADRFVTVVPDAAFWIELEYHGDRRTATIRNLPPHIRL